MADITRSRAFAPAPPWRLIALALVIIALIASALIYVGASRQVPAPPFGPARNGLVTYEVGGDIYVSDPVTGNGRLVVGGPTEDSAPGFSTDGTMLAFLRMDAGHCCMSGDVSSPDPTEPTSGASQRTPSRWTPG